jgi:hypothetical protein
MGEIKIDSSDLFVVLDPPGTQMISRTLPKRHDALSPRPSALART